MNIFELGVLDGRHFLGQDDFLIWDCYTEGKGVFDGKFHFHDFYELSFVYDGEGVYTINGSSFSVGKAFFFSQRPLIIIRFRCPRAVFCGIITSSFVKIF